MPEAIGMCPSYALKNLRLIQARIDSGKQVIVGVNKHLADVDEDISVLVVDNERVRQAQIERLQLLKNRDDYRSRSVGCTGECRSFRRRESVGISR